MTEPVTLVLFGATGDLATSKILPALYALANKELLPADFRLIGIGRTLYSDLAFQDYLQAHVGSQHRTDLFEKIINTAQYLAGDVTDTLLYQQLTSIISTTHMHRNIVWQLSILPTLYEAVVTHLGTLDLSSHGWRRILIEKPFGTSLDAAKRLEQVFSQYFSEEQIFRIDHYVSKETVQNIIAFRFGNGLFEPIWNAAFIDHMQITMLEEQGIGKRGMFYDTVGALRDVVQNHLLQVLALTCMDVPQTFTAAALREQRTRLLSSVQTLSHPQVISSTVRGQYLGYLDEANIPAASTTETYASLRLELESDRWAGMPIYLRTGKKTSQKITEVSIVFKQKQEAILAQMHGLTPQANILTLRITPNEGIVLRFLAKQPGASLTLTPATMQFCYHDVAGPLMDAYERVILDTIKGDHMLFTSAAEVREQWRITDPISKTWEQGSVPLFPYAKGSDGPQEADFLLAQENRQWLEPSPQVCARV